jgi:4-amino-4-deoxy-L-arabinose transferase-like glycosyltransferase
MSRSVSGYGWVYFVGSVYYILGRNQLFVQCLNGLMGGLTVLVIYAIAARLLDRPAARWAALFMAFFPQVVFWSTGMYKDPPILLCIALAMYAVLKLRERLSLSMVALFVVAEVVLITLRFYIAYFVLFAALATFVFARRHGVMRMVITYGLLLGVLYGALHFAVQRETLEQQTTYMTLERLQTTREDQAMWGRSGFGQEYDVSTPTGALSALPTGLVYLLFAPFPWAVSGLRQALVVPETLVWYALMPAFVRGLTFATKKNLRAVLPIVVFAVSLTVAYALMQGNVGTAYRQRTQITMFFFIFMGVGVAERRRQRTLGTAGTPTPVLQHQP